MTSWTPVILDGSLQLLLAVKTRLRQHKAAKQQKETTLPKKITSQIRRTIERNARKVSGAPDMRRQLETAVSQGKIKGELPSVRAISDILRKARQQPAEELYKVAEVTWPDSFDDEVGLLPWRAAAGYFELLRELHGRRPLMPLMHWYWRVTQAAPDAPSSERHNMAAVLALKECLPMLSLGGLETAQDPPAIEVYLLFAPWRSNAAMEAYVSGVPKEQRYEPHALTWGAKKGSPEASLAWYAAELTEGVFTLDARDRYAEYVQQESSAAELARTQRVGRRK